MDEKDLNKDSVKTPLEEEVTEEAAEEAVVEEAAEEVTEEAVVEEAAEEAVVEEAVEEVAEESTEAVATGANVEASDEEEVNEDELFFFVPENVESMEKITAPRYSYWKSVFRVFFKKKSNWVALFLLILILIMGFGYGLVVGTDFQNRISNPNILDTTTYNLTPQDAIARFGFHLRYILGTSSHGAPLWDQIWGGSRLSLSLAFVCAAINMTIGILIGAVWGFSKKFDVVMLEVYNIIGNIPYILFISVFVRALGSGFWYFVLALTVTGWLGTAYFIRTQVLIIRDREYNLASKCLGTGLRKIVTRNILPFLTSVIVTIVATEVPSYISYEVYLNYLGIGFAPTDTSLGRLIADGQKVMDVYPIQFWAPVTVAAAITIILYVAGQNLADASDPRTHM